MARTVLKISGSDAIGFLQGLITNDMAKLAQGPVYAALLTPQGKYLADFIVSAAPGADAGVLLDVDSSLAPMLAQRLSMYKMRADVQITDSGLQVRRGTGPAPEGALPDPRHPALGWRLYGTEAGEDGTDFLALRVAHMVPETGIELGADSYILEMGFERLNGVDFRKGCYVGQEVTARMKHKTELKKGLALIALDGVAQPGTVLTDANGKEAGQVHSVCEDRALAYLRFDRATGPLQAGGARAQLLERG